MQKQGDAKIVVFDTELEKWLRNDSGLAGSPVVLGMEKKHIAQWFADFAATFLQDCIAVRIEELMLLSDGYEYDADSPNAVVSFQHRGKKNETWYQAAMYLSSGWDDYFEWSGGSNVDAKKVVWNSNTNYQWYPGTKGSMSGY